MATQIKALIWALAIVMARVIWSWFSAAAFSAQSRAGYLSRVGSRLPVNPSCLSCLDAEGWTEMVERLEAEFQSMLSEQ